VQDRVAAYQEFTVAGRGIDARLRVADADGNIARRRWLWHCVLDLLTCLLFPHRLSSSALPSSASRTSPPGSSASRS